MNEKIRVLDTFSGIGGFSLGFRRAGGFKTVAYCEIDPYSQAVLSARMREGWLDLAPICTDIRRLDGRPFRGIVNLVCGGFPCQDISVAGHGVGIEGERSGLWGELLRLICEIRPGYAVLENVAALAFRGLDRVLGDLASSGYDAEWQCIPASAFGAPHIRDRIWIVAYPQGLQRKEVFGGASDRILQADDTHANGPRKRQPEGRQQDVWGWTRDVGKEGRVADPGSIRWRREAWEWLYETPGCRWWCSEPEVGRVAHGVPLRVDRLRTLGNALIPQAAEWIGRRIMRIENA